MLLDYNKCLYSIFPDLSSLTVWRFIVLPENYLDKAKKLETEGQIEKSIALYQKAIALSNPSGALYEISRLLLKVGRLSKALETYQQLMDWASLDENCDPSQIEAMHCHLGKVVIRLAIMQGRLEEARELFQRNLDTQNSSFWYLYLFGNVLNKQGDDDNALVFYQRSLEIQPDFYQVNSELGKFFVAQKSWRKAFKHHIDAIRVRPDFHDAHKGWFMCFERCIKAGGSNYLNEEIDAYRNLVEVNTPNLDMVSAYLNMAKASIRLGKISEAIQHNEKATYYTVRGSYPCYASRYWDYDISDGPDFIIVGVMKCGTTALYDYITQHPQVIPCAMKEINAEGLAQFPRRFRANRDYYLSFFPRINKEEKFVTGEASPIYIRVPSAPKLVLDNFPNAKIIIILREPIKRLISQYNFFLMRDRESRSLEEVIRSEIEILEQESDFFKVIENYGRTNQHFLAHGLYTYYIERWMNLLPDKNFLIIKSEDLRNRPLEVMNQAFDFLGLSEYSSIHITEKNKGNYSSVIDEELLFRLQDFYRPHNERLGILLGQNFNWEYF